MLQTRSSILLVAVTNTAAGGGSAVVVTNSSNIFITNTSLTVMVQNSANWAVYALDSQALGSVVSAIASTVGTVTLAAANTRRVSLAIYNASTNPLFMRLGASATTAAYTLMMVGSGYYELPRPIYSGIITGIWQTAAGSAFITETT